MDNIQLTKIDGWPTAAGQYNFDQKGRVILACPVCAGVFVCIQEVKQREPLTLAPSVLGPQLTTKYESESLEQVLAPCMHHFWVKDGYAVDIDPGPYAKN